MKRLALLAGLAALAAAVIAQTSAPTSRPVMLSWEGVGGLRWHDPPTPDMVLDPHASTTTQPAARGKVYNRPSDSLLVGGVEFDPIAYRFYDGKLIAASFHAFTKDANDYDRAKAFIISLFGPGVDRSTPRTTTFPAVWSYEISDANYARVNVGMVLVGTRKEPAWSVSLSISVMSPH